MGVFITDFYVFNFVYIILRTSIFKQFYCIFVSTRILIVRKFFLEKSRNEINLLFETLSVLLFLFIIN